MKVNKIYILTDAPVPTGFAVTNRLLSYAKGFVKNGMACEVIVMRKTEHYTQPVNLNPSGEIGGIKYRYLYKSTVRSKHFVKRRWDDFYGLFSLIGFILGSLNGKTVALYYSSHTRYALLLSVLGYFKKYLLLKEENDMPWLYSGAKKMPLKWFIYRKIHFNLFDGLLLMTENLINYFKKNHPDIKHVLIPMTVDLERFEKITAKKEKSFAYVGSLSEEKDGVFTLLKAFSKMSRKYNDYKLVIYSYTNSSKLKKEFYELIKNLDLQERVIMKGSVENSKLPVLLKSFTFLVSPRPDTEVAHYAFPTKLGDYLASGIPTVVTSAGEVPNYLQDGVSSFIAKPGDVDSLAEKMTEALDDEQRAKKIGENGRKVAEKYFNNVIQTKKILQFIRVSF
jgi:glycosyltransferase involved in cell wall biosynthesis